MAKKLKLPIELECPEKVHIIIGYLYGVLCFCSMPFLVLLTSMDLWQDAKVLTWYELVYHILNFCVCIGIFREFLQDSFFLFGINRKKIFSTVRIAVLAMLLVVGIWYVLYKITNFYPLLYGIYGTLPLSEMDILSLGSDIVFANPIVGLVIMVILSPLVCSCLYYAIGFAPAFNVRPWLGYVVIAIVVALPRICNGLTHWNPVDQALLYCVQLPLHMVACWSYHKAENIFAPILTLMTANLLACGRILVMLFLGQ